MIRKRMIIPGTYRISVTFHLSPGAPRVFTVTGGKRGRGGWHITEDGQGVGPGFKTLVLAVDHIAQLTGQGAYDPNRSVGWSGP